MNHKPQTTNPTAFFAIDIIDATHGTNNAVLKSDQKKGGSVETEPRVT